VDNGLGIEPEFAEKVFVIFQRLHARDAYPGTGIGLAVAKKIVEYHGGQIWVDTDYFGGTAIRMTLPAVA
jgi:light-regulated signal transduction histidine kinase (bacteriophytochrome)